MNAMYSDLAVTLFDNEIGEIRAEFTASKYVPAYTWGKPEDCYPAEGGEVEEIIEVRSEDGPFSPLSDLEDRIQEAAQNALDSGRLFSFTRLINDDY